MNHLAQLIVFRPYRGTPRRRMVALALLALAMLALPVAALATPSATGRRTRPTRFRRPVGP